MHPEDPDQTGQVPAQQAKRELLRQQGTLNRRPEAVQYPLFQTSDFFDAQDLIQVKYEMLRRVEIDKASVSQAAGEFGFSRPSFYQAQSAFQSGGLTGLLPQKRGPRQAHKITQQVLELASKLRTEQPELSWEQIAAQIGSRLGVRLHPRSIERGWRRSQKKR